MRVRLLIVLIAGASLGASGCRLWRQTPLARRPSECPGRAAYAGEDRVRAMLTIVALANAWDAPTVRHPEALAPPAPAEVAWAVELLRCDDAPDADSRRGRAIAKLLAHDWEGEKSTPLLLDLGFAKVGDVRELKRRIIAEFSLIAYLLHARDVEWLEYAVLRHLTTQGGIPTGTAVTPPGSSCWQPETKSTFTYVNPYVEMTAHVSVNVGVHEVRENTDAQSWNECGALWSPPNPSPPPKTLDGAYFMKRTWSALGPCNPPPPPISPDPGAPLPGTIYGINVLHERFFFILPLNAGDVTIENALAIWTSTTNNPPTGGNAPTHHLDYRLGSCVFENVEGAIGGSIGAQTLTTVLDSGWIEVWEQGGRTHVQSYKKVQFSIPGANWLSALNPALYEANDELGEIACCLKKRLP